MLQAAVYQVADVSTHTLVRCLVHECGRWDLTRRARTVARGVGPARTESRAAGPLGICAAILHQSADVEAHLSG